MHKLRIGINGFGRIGRVASRIILNRPNLELAAINSRSDPASHVYLLKHDSTYGTISKEIKANGDRILIDGSEIAVFQADHPRDIPWSKAKVDMVIDASGKFLTRKDLSGHLSETVTRVVLSAPAKDDIKTIVIGVNEATWDSDKDTIVSNSSCTTNCLATTIRVLKESYGVKHGFMMTTHAVTDSQNLLDNSHSKEVRLRRSAFQSMIPSGTGSAKDISKLYPDLSGKLICQSVRVPLPTVSMIHLVVEVSSHVSVESVNAAFRKYASSKLQSILSVCEEELVSRDFTADPHSSIVDPFLTEVIGNLVSVTAWYDNEWGYANRLADLVELVGKKLK